MWRARCPDILVIDRGAASFAKATASRGGRYRTSEVNRPASLAMNATQASSPLQ